MRVGVLGAAEAFLDGATVDLGTRKQRALLAALALHRGRPVSPDTIVDLLWADSPPAAVTPTLQGYVSNLRRALEPDRAPRAPSQVLVTQDAGYALVLPDGALDTARFESAVTHIHQRVGSTALVSAERPARPGDLEMLYVDLDAALALWRGVAFAELEDATSAMVERARLEEFRMIALEDRATIALELGQHATAAAELEALTATYPLRERLWSLRALALTRSGRQADALEVLRQVRELLADELGLEPGTEIRELQTAVLRQDPGLQWIPGPRPVPAAERTLIPRRTPVEPGLPLVGRDDQLMALVALLDETTSGRPTFAVLTGEAGIGKSRLCAELVARASDARVGVLVGRCSQDEGAPPLWPWASVLRELGQELPSETGADDSASRFRAWESIVATVLEAAEQGPLLVVLDDLHWADASTLRVLRLLAETAETGSLMVLSTWRHEPAPTGALAEAAEMLARRHALRLHLEGLDAADSGRVVASVADSAPTDAEADALRERTEGNPFFLVEYGRLATERGDLAELLAEPDPPAAVHDVLARRIAVLPEDTARALQVACVAGRHFDVPTLADALGADEDQVLDDLEPALRAGLVREDGVDRFRFAHALVRDTLYVALSRSRRARVHAGLAEALDGEPGRESEVARHWLAAGAQHASQAWRSATTAARAARRVFAYEESVKLLRAAAAAVDEDALADVADRYDVLLELAGALQLAGNWVDLRSVVHRTISVAEELGDLDRLVDASVIPTTGALWQAAHHGEVDEVVVTALRSALERLPDGDGEQRCRVMLSLSSEIYYGSSPAEREALAEEAIAMARRLGDPALLLSSCLSGAISMWRGATAPQRYALTDEASSLAERLDDQMSLSSALTLRTAAAGELGWMDEMERGFVVARECATRQRHLYGHLVLDALELAWHALRGEFDDVDRLLADMVALGETMSLPQFDDALAGAMAMRLMWSGQEDDLLYVLVTLQQTSILPLGSIITGLMCRAGRLDEARDYIVSPGLRLEKDTWFSPMAWSLAAEASVHLGDRQLAVTTYELLSGLAGRPACAGSGSVIGPVDIFLAMAAAASGSPELATQHADRAEALCSQWRAPLAAQWVREQRTRFGF